MAIGRSLLLFFGVAVLGALLYAVLMLKPHTSQVRIGDVVILVEVVDTPAAQQRGLSGRSSLPEESGMLFIFPSDDTWAFWMKDMRFSIDMIWAAHDGTIVKIERDVSPETYPASFAPPVPARYVLEVPAGFSARKGITEGMQLTVLN